MKVRVLSMALFASVFLIAGAASTASASNRYTVVNTTAGHFNTSNNPNYTFYTTSGATDPFEYPHDMFGQGALLTNKKYGYYMGRVFDGNYFYSTLTDAPATGVTFRFGKRSSSMICTWGGPGAGVIAKGKWSDNAVSSTLNSCPTSESEAINMLPEIAITSLSGPKWNCGEGSADRGPQVTTLSAATPFGYNAGWTRVSGGAKAAGSITDRPLDANFTLPRGTVVGYRYTSDDKAIVYVPRFGWGFVNASSVNRVSGQWIDTNSIERYGADAARFQFACSNPGNGFTPNTDPISGMPWSGMQGKVTSGAGVSSWGGGRMDLFVRAADNRIAHRPYDNGTWYGWDDAGGGTTITSDPAATSWGTGRIDVVARGMDNSLIHKAWSPSTGWTGWGSVGGVLAGSPSITSRPGNVLDIYVRGTDNALWQKYWTPSGGWGGWISQGGTLASDPAVVSWDANRVDVFGQGTEGNIQWKYWNAGSGWSAWINLAGAMQSGPSVTSVRPGQLTLTAIGPNRQPMMRTYENGVWTGWQGLGHYLISDPEVVSKASGNYDVFGRTDSNGIVRFAGTL